MQHSNGLATTRRAALGAMGLALALPALHSVRASSFAPTLLYPIASTLDSSGAIYVADLLLPGVWKITEGKVSIFHQAEKKYRNPLFHPRAITAIDKDLILVSDTAARDVFLVKPNEKPKGLTGGRLDIPAAILQVERDIYVADTERNEIWKGGVTEKWSKWADVPAPRGLALHGDKSILVVSGRDNVLYSIPSAGGKSEKVAQGEASGYWTSVAVGKDGVPVVVDSYAKTLWRIESGKPVAWVKGDPFDHPVHITRSADNFLATDSRAKALFEVTLDGKVRQLELIAG